MPVTRTNDRSVALLFITLTALYAFGAIASLVRLRFGDEAIINLTYQRAALPIVLMICAYIAAQRFVHLINGFLLLLVALMIYGIVWGAAHNGFNYFTIIHLFAMMVAIFPYLAGRSIITAHAAQFRAEVRRMCYLVTIVHIPVMILYLYWAMSGVVYFGMSASILILCAMFFIDESRWKWAIVAAVMIVVSGKRAEILGLGLGIAAWFVIRGAHGHLARVAKPFLVLLCGTFLFGVLALSGNAGGLVGSLGEKFDTFLLADFTDLTSDSTRAAIGGRGAELTIFAETFFTQGLDRILLGLGYGWNTPVLSVAGGEVDRLAVVHVSPLNAIGQYGLLLGAVFWGWIFTMAIRAIFSARELPGNRVFAPYVIGMLFVSLSAYAISVDPGFWLCLGACSVAAAQQRAPGRHSGYPRPGRYPVRSLA